VSSTPGETRSAAPPLGTDRVDSFEIHPHASAGIGRVGGVLGIAAVVLLAGSSLGRSVAPGNVRDLLLTLGLVGGVGALLALYMRHYLHTNRLYVTPTVVGQLTALLSRPREVPRDRVARLLQVTVEPWWARTAYFYLLVVGTDGRCLMRIQSMYYDDADIAAYARAIGVPLDSRPGTVGPGRLQKEIPGALPLIVRHPFELMLLALVAIAAVGCVVIFVLAFIQTCCTG